MPAEDWLNVAAATLALLLALAALVPGLVCLVMGRAVRVVDVVVQARWRVPEPPRRRAWRAVAIGVVLLAGGVVTLLVSSHWSGMVFSGGIFCTLFLRARPLDQARDRKPGLPAQLTSSDPVQLQTPYYPGARRADRSDGAGDGAAPGPVRRAPPRYPRRSA